MVLCRETFHPRLRSGSRFLFCRHYCALLVLVLLLLLVMPILIPLMLLPVLLVLPLLALLLVMLVLLVLMMLLLLHSVGAGGGAVLSVPFFCGAIGMDTGLI